MTQTDVEIPCSGIRQINTVKMTIRYQSNQQIQCNPYQITNSIFHRIRINNLQFVWKQTRRS